MTALGSCNICIQAHLCSRHFGAEYVNSAECKQSLPGVRIVFLKVRASVFYLTPQSLRMEKTQWGNGKPGVELAKSDCRKCWVGEFHTYTLFQPIFFKTVSCLVMPKLDLTIFFGGEETYKQISQFCLKLFNCLIQIKEAKECLLINSFILKLIRW